jgi:hypothetical protein
MTAENMRYDYALDPDHEPPIGAHMLTRRWGYTHHGIYVGQGRAVQYGGLSFGLRRGPVEEVALSEFSLGRAIWIRSPGAASLDREEVVRRARSRLGENRYHVLKNHCEHFCEWCASGEHRSYQVDRLIARASFLRIFDLRLAGDPMTEREMRRYASDGNRCSAPEKGVEPTHSVNSRPSCGQYL